MCIPNAQGNFFVTGIMKFFSLPCIQIATTIQIQ